MGKAIGIDLGTTNSAAAIDEGRLRVLPTPMNEPLTPSVVSFQASRRGRPGVILVGRAALNNAVSAPAETILSIKRLMGRTVDEREVAQVRQRYPYTVTEADDANDRGVRVVLNETKYSPIQISSMILRQITEGAERALGEKVTHAVITVPAYFSEAQIAATRTAGLEAGLVVKRMIDEPTAAAVAFGMERSEESHRVLVFDLGGGTFDLSIIQMVDGQFQVLAVEGDMWLGGDDFDWALVSRISDWIREEHGADPSEDRRFLMLARERAEKAKIALSGQEEYRLVIPGALHPTERALIDVDMTITRDEFEAMAQPFVDRCMEKTRGILTQQNLTPGDITAVLLVGGSTATPLVHESIISLFGVEKVKRFFDPMQCVALGAGILAKKLTGVECPECLTENPEDARKCRNCDASLATARSVGDIELGSVTAKSLGIAAVGTDDKPDTYAVIIHKGTQYPLSRPLERNFYTTSENLIRILVYEGDDAVASDNELQGTIEFELPTKVEPNTAVIVSFNYDKDRVLTVGIRVPSYPGMAREETLERDRARPDAAEQDEKWREELEATANTADYFLETYREYLERGAAAKMESDIRKAKRAYAEGDRGSGQQLTEALSMTILGVGVASQLFLSERAMETGATPEQADNLSRAVRELKEAHRRGDERRVQQISMALQLGIVRMYQEQARRAEKDGRDFDGVPRVGQF